MLRAGLAERPARDMAQAARHGRGAAQAMVLRGRRSTPARALRADLIR
jgi:hypothetical protein